ncbi:hypothetical protein [Nocardia sp. NPDC004860]|uniref:hypothetical protein n=1 Tax=Nocardia sp. NPDC004860 TaxID=3154557 RepID=UPI0033B46029
MGERYRGLFQMREMACGGDDFEAGIAECSGMGGCVGGGGDAVAFAPEEQRRQGHLGQPGGQLGIVYGLRDR